jgi:hypothetical protein
MGFLPNETSGGGGGGTTIGVVANYASLPAAGSVSGQFRWVQSSTGIYLTGLYYSNGVTWEFNPADNITVVANYSALPAVGTVTGQFYWCSASQGTAWLPGSFGGTYYSAGLYYSNGVSWEFLSVPYNATQSEVHTGTNNDKFVTPATLAGEKDATGGIVGMTLFKINFKNAANTFTSFFTNTNTASRTYTFQDSDGTIAHTSDIPIATYHGGSLAVFSPGDSTVTYFGLSTPLAPGGTDTLRQFKGVNGTVKTATIYVDPTTTAGSNEAVTYALWNVTDGVSVGDIGAISYDVRGNQAFFSGLSLATLSTKYYAFRITNPAFATNPTNCYTRCEANVF